MCIYCKDFCNKARLSQIKQGTDENTDKIATKKYYETPNERKIFSNQHANLFFFTRLFAVTS